MYKRRIILFLAFIFLAFVALLLRLGALQIVNGDDCRREFEKMIHSRYALPAVRGSILDNHGRILAQDKPCFELSADYGMLSDDPDWINARVANLKRKNKLTREQARQQLQEMIDRSKEVALEAAGSPEEFQAAVKRILTRVQAIERAIGQKSKQSTEAHPLVTDLDDAAANILRGKLDGTIGLSVQPAERRSYPEGDAAPHVIGITGPVTTEDLEKHNLTKDEADELRRLMENYYTSDRIGQFGIEKMCEDVLRGTRGYRLANRDTGEDQVVEAQHGKDVQLTIDIDLQKELAARFREMVPAHNGSIVLLNVEDGSILAMVSLPAYDLNTYRKDYPRLVQDDFDFTLLNRAVGVLQPPGSTAKPAAAMAALSEKLINAGTTFFCRGSLFGDPEKGFKCTSSHGELDLINAIRFSCNVFFYHTGELLEHKRPGLLVDYFRQFGYCDPPGTGLPGERAGIAKPPSGETKVGDSRSLAIGQGPIAVTPMHVANLMATIARNGEFLSPVITRDGGPEQVRRNLNLSPEHFALVKKGMHAVTSVPQSTAYGAFRNAALGFEVCGKSGTAKVGEQWRYRKDANGQPILDAQGRKEKEILRSGNMVWFAGFAPYQNPKIAYAVLVEYVDWDEEGGGAKVAAPIAVEALRACTARGYIK